MARVMILLGPPGAGKGTQAVRLSDALSLPHVSTGDLFRENTARGSDLGRRAKEYMEAGQLVPDELVLEMLFERVSRPDCAEGYLLDGFPRTVAQAEALQARLDAAVPVRVLGIEVPDQSIVERLAGRLTCRPNGHVQHLVYAPPARDGICDQCGGELYRRPDDEPEAIRERLSQFAEKTRPLVDFYESRGLLVRIDGDRAPDAVFEGLLEAASREEVV